MVAFEILFACFLAMLGLAGSVLTTVYSDWVHEHEWVRWIGWGCLCGSIFFLVAAILQWKRAHRRLIIHRALWYGDDPEISNDKTRFVRNWIDENTIHHKVHQDELGDDPKGEVKKLEVMYSLGSAERRTVITINGKTLIIPESVAPK